MISNVASMCHSMYHLFVQLRIIFEVSNVTDVQEKKKDFFTLQGQTYPQVTPFFPVKIAQCWCMSGLRLQGKYLN